ncbi:anti-sigma factor [Filimonas effusa]|uniref:anti-sigma factor n=1 Tax=Filimonas effusa TaxID=2508721 RepID=UPI0013E92ABB|nr:anti-sigma factor [Filimonas effusa]
MDIQAYIQSGIIESYVLGLASHEETEELLRLASEHPAVQKAILAAEAAFERNAIANAITPGNDIRNNLLSALQQDFTASAPPDEDFAPRQSSLTSIKTGSSKPVVKASIWKAMAAAAIILLVVSAAINFYLYNHYRSSHDKYVALLAEKNSLQASVDITQARFQQMNESMSLMADPAMALVKMPGVAGKESNLATVYWNSQTKEVYLLQNHLPQVPAGKQYQLWAIVNGKPVDAGMVATTCTGLCKMKTIPTAQAFAITLENQGGSPVPGPDMFVLGKV